MTNVENAWDRNEAQAGQAVCYIRVSFVVQSMRVFFGSLWPKMFAMKNICRS